jgi:uncharacterized protein YqiB (DUF1249 family)
VKDRQDLVRTLLTHEFVEQSENNRRLQRVRFDNNDKQRDGKNNVEKLNEFMTQWLNGMECLSLINLQRVRK